MIRPFRPIIVVVAALAALAGSGAAGAAAANEVLQLADMAAEDGEIGDGPDVDEDSLHDLVADAQRLLRLRGYDPGPVDGRLGWRTQRAIREYQATARSHGYLEALNGPGVAGRDAAPAAGPEMVRVGDRPPATVK